MDYDIRSKEWKTESVSSNGHNVVVEYGEGEGQEVL